MLDTIHQIHGHIPFADFVIRDVECACPMTGRDLIRRILGELRGKGVDALARAEAERCRGLNPGFKFRAAEMLCALTSKPEVD